MSRLKQLLVALCTVVIFCGISLQVMHIPLHLSSPVALLTRNCHAPLQDTVTVSGVAKVLPPRVMISYAYYEKDAIQRQNFEFFITAGMAPHERLEDITVVYVITPGECSPCSRWSGSQPAEPLLAEAGISAVGFIENGVILYRTRNEGMDLASHNVSIEYMRRTDQLRRYKYFIMLNSSIKGPFFPQYMPKRWHWVDAFLELYEGDVHAVASSLVCLPVIDAGGPGPRLESWAFSVDSKALGMLLQEGVFNIRNCKLCQDDKGIVVGGEYGITSTLLKNGYNVATLMSRYARETNWADLRHWACNDNVHPSREGTYDGISLHPFETLFVKSSWHVSDTFTAKYARWRLAHLAGDAGTAGAFDEARYQYAISLEAQEPHPLENVLAGM